MVSPRVSGPLQPGKELLVFDEVMTSSFNLTHSFNIDAESILISLFVESLSGDLDVTVYTQGKDGEETAVITFPTISAPSSELFLKKAASVLQRIRVRVTGTAGAVFNIRARGVSAGASSVKLLGSNEAKNYSNTVTTTPSLLIPVNLTDRVGVAIHNTDPVKTIYMGFTIASCNTTDGWEISPGEKLGLDVSSGVELYGLVTSGTAIIKVLEAGN